MIYKDWEIIYKKIAKDFNYPIEKEEKSANFLNKLIEKHKPFSINKLEDLIKNKHVAIFGAGPSLEDSLKNQKKSFIEKTLIVADGATTALLKYGIQSDIIVTDLDGKIDDQIYINNKGSLIIIHAHGDNIDKIEKYFSEFVGNVIGTTQIDPKKFKNIYNFGGFTDGDRALFIADHFNAKTISLFGFDFNSEIGKYSYMENKDISQKFKKLKWCKYLIELIFEKNHNVYFK